MNTFLYSSFSFMLFFMGFSRSYGIALPIWVFWLFPISWFFILPISIIIYSIVFYVSAICLKIDKPFKVLRKTILKVSLFGFLCDMSIVIGMIFIPFIIYYILLLFSKFGLTSIVEKINNSLNYVYISPLKNISALLIMFSTILLSRIINYKLNKRYTFSKLDIEEKKKKKLALYMSMVTAAYLFFR